MKKHSFPIIMGIVLLASTTLKAATPPPDTTANCVYYIKGKATNGTVNMYKQDYHNEGIPAEVMAEHFTNESGKAEKPDFKQIDSMRIGELLFAKSRYYERGITSMSEEEMSLVRMLCSGSKASVYYAYSYDKKAQTYSKSLLVDKINEKKPVDVQRGMWMLAFKKQLANLFSDCEAVSKKAAEKAYGTGKEAVISATKEYNEVCK